MLEESYAYQYDLPYCAYSLEFAGCIVVSGLQKSQYYRARVNITNIVVCIEL
jgi:hypothetical protein